ncbi:MAG: CBS domain-containing protein [Actinomycetota bacterium]|nr:CBS domain-containing protein [Actinomycetota bacterium]
MEIGPLTTRSVLTVKATDSLYNAAVSMMERGVGSAVILTDGKPSGIVTDRESLRAIAQRKDAKTSPVGEFVTGRLTTVSPSLEILEAARVMREKAFRHLVVVDDNGALIGVFSMRDLVVGLLEERSSLAGAGQGNGAAAS